MMLIRYSCILILLIILPQVTAIQNPSCFATSMKLDTKRKRNRIIDVNNVMFQCNNNIQSVKRSTDLISFSTIRGGDNGNNNQTKTALSASLFLTYLTVMAAKCALPSTLALLTAPNSGLLHHNVLLSRQDVISRLLALSTVSIATGKLLLGPVIDSLGGISSLQIALTILFICLGSISTQILCPTLISFAIYWIIVDFAFSACWAACVKSIRDYLPEESWSKEIGRLAMAARLGNTISFTAFASLLQWASTTTYRSTITQSTAQVSNSAWRLVYRASGVIQLVPLAMLTYFREKKSIIISDDNITSKDNPQIKSKERSTLRQSLSILGQQSKRLEFWLHLISRSIIMVLVSFLLFIPSYMTQCFDMSSGASARVGSAFAMGCLLAVSSLSEKTYPSDVTRQRSSRSKTYRRKAYAMTGFLTTATVCLILQTAYLKNIVNLTPVLGTLLMFLFGFSLAIPFYLPSSMFALKRGGEDGSATIADAFDICGFVMLAFFNGYVARVLDAKTKQAWLPVFKWMLGGSITAIISLFGAIWLEGRREA